MSWKIIVEKGNLSFSAAHFIILEGTFEPLHGHNYAVSAEITSDTLMTDSYVVDFGVVKRILRTLTAEMNHRFLMPLHNPLLTLHEFENEWEIILPDHTRFIMPKVSVVPLAVDNATAERLAEWFAHGVQHHLYEAGARHLTSITVGVAETDMQTAYHTLDLRSFS